MIKRVIIILYAIAIIVMAMATFFPQQTADELFYGTWWFSLLWAILTALGIAYMVKQHMRRPSLVLLHGSFVIILLGALLTHLTGVHTSMHLQKGLVTNHLDNGDELPFTVTLDSFSVIYHNGTEAAADFVSELTINSEEHTTISMNNIYSKGGVRLYQSGYDPDMQGAYVIVNMDPWGIPVTYVGYALLFLSVVWMLIDPKLGFRKSLRKLTLMVVLCLCAPAVYAASTLPEAQAEMVGRLNMLYNDRICPVQTYALDFTKKISGSRSYKGYNAEQVLTGFLFFPKEWNKEPVIRIKSSAIRDKFGLEKYCSLSDFFNANGYILGKTIQEVYQGNDDKLHQEVKKLDDKIMLIMSLQHGSGFNIFPYEGKWYAPSDSLPHHMEPERMAYIRHALPLLGSYAATSNWKDFSEMAGKMLKYQYTYGIDGIPSNTQLTCERLYNAVPWATILFMVCLTMGLLSIFFQRPSRWGHIGMLLSQCVLMLSWVALTFSLVLRWIVSGTIPLTNGYESMLFLAWIIMLAAILTMRFIPLLLTFGLLASGFCLLVSHIGQLDPQISHVMPVLNSPLLSIHVSIIMMAYALLALTMLCSIWGLIRKQEEAERMRHLSLVLLYPAITCLAFGIFIGAVWANVSWGSYWQWDPKETWALITFMIYAVPLHSNSLPAFRNPRVYHLYVLLAFLSVLITYFGVNYLLGGMHSYA